MSETDAIFDANRRVRDDAAPFRDVKTLPEGVTVAGAPNSDIPMARVDRLATAGPCCASSSSTTTPSADPTAV